MTSLGWTEYTRNSNAHSSTVATGLTPVSTIVEVIDASVLPPATTEDPGVIWINAERIEYHAVVGNTLFDIRRGTLGSAPANHEVGARVFDGSADQHVPDPHAFVVNPSQRNNHDDGTQSTVTDPWFEVEYDSNGDPMKDSNGNVVLFVTTPQSEFLMEEEGIAIVGNEIT